MATPTPTRAEMLATALARVAEIQMELAAGPWGPNFSEQGRSVDLVGYRKSLIDEMNTLVKDTIPLLQDPWEVHADPGYC